MGTTQGGSVGVATAMPSTAPSTEIAGVITPSPYSSAAPNRPSPTSSRRAPTPLRAAGAAGPAGP